MWWWHGNPDSVSGTLSEAWADEPPGVVPGGSFFFQRVSGESRVRISQTLRTPEYREPLRGSQRP